MQVIVQRRFGMPLDVLRLEEVDVPVPGEGEVTLDVRAAGVNALDWHLVTGEPRVMRLAGLGLRRPANPGVGRDVAGVVREVGPGVTSLAPGDEVLGWCEGAFAEVAVARERHLVPKPPAVTDIEAAALPVAATTALQAVRDAGEVRAGERVLITGASGGVGSFAVQLADHLGAEVTAVCSTRNVELVRGLGAHHIIDYTRAPAVGSGGASYEVIIDLAGRPPLRDCRRSLVPGGRLVLASGAGGPWVGPLDRMVGGMVLGRAGDWVVRTLSATETREDTIHLAGLLAAGDLRSVIERSYPLADAPAAVEHLRLGHTRGKVVLTVD